MRLGGLQKQSLIDYPGKVACVLFLSGCNFDCPYCHNPDLARGCATCPANLDGDRLFDFLEQRKGFLDGVVISGGEPTLQGDLEALCRTIKAMGYPVKMDTNGSRPSKIRELIEGGLVDYIAMDIKTDPFRYVPLIKRDFDPKAILASIDIIMASGMPYEFRTTCIPSLVDDRTIERIVMLIQGARLYAIQQFQETEVLHPECFKGGLGRYHDDDLSRFQAIAKPWVERCIVR